MTYKTDYSVPLEKLNFPKCPEISVSSVGIHSMSFDTNPTSSSDIFQSAPGTALSPSVPLKGCSLKCSSCLEQGLRDSGRWTSIHPPLPRFRLPSSPTQPRCVLPRGLPVVENLNSGLHWAHILLSTWQPRALTYSSFSVSSSAEWTPRGTRPLELLWGFMRKSPARYT